MISAYPALVLNADFSPVSTYPLSQWDLARTMRNVLKGGVIVLESYDALLRSPSTSYRPASVVALKKYVLRPDIVPFTRMNVFLRDDFSCQYCGRKHSPEDLTFDHVIPRAAGGRSGFENICAACIPCNTRKGHRLDMAPIRKPTRPTSWDLRKKRRIATDTLHKSWIDYLYWSGLLETD